MQRSPTCANAWRARAFPTRLPASRGPTARRSTTCASWSPTGAIDFDWRAQEARLNALPQFKVPLHGIDLHYLCVPGRGPDPCPLLLSHGWPGSVFEFLDLIPRLTDPARFGGDAADAFTVVAPSLPGYGLSFAPGQPRFGVEAIADCFAELMTDVLGHRRFAAQGGDWGAFVTSRLGAVHADKVIGIHVNLLTVRRDPKLLANPTPEEQQFLRELEHFLKEDTGYQWIQGTRPQTLAFGLSDSPAGLAAWIVEKFRAWSDCGGDVESVFTQRPVAGRHRAVLVQRRHRLVVLAVLRASARAVADSRQRRRGADGLRAVSARDPQAAALGGADDVQGHPPLERDAARRPLRGDGAAAGAGARDRRVLQAVARPLSAAAAQPVRRRVRGTRAGAAQMPRIFLASPSDFIESSCLPALCAVSPSARNCLTLVASAALSLGIARHLGVDGLHVVGAVVGQRQAGSAGQRGGDQQFLHRALLR